MSCVLISPSAMDGVNYHDYASGLYFSSLAPVQAPESMSFNSSFSSQPDYVVTPYSASSSFDSMDGSTRSHRSFSEAFAHPATESFGAPTPVRHHNAASMGQAPRTPPSAPAKFPAVPISPSQVAPRQKAKRTPTACEECRKRKQKCDGETPCQACKEQKLTCRYREVCPTKKDNSLEKMMNLWESYGKALLTLTERLDTITSTLRQIEHRLTRCWRCGGTVELSSGNCESCGHVSCAVQNVESMS